MQTITTQPTNKYVSLNKTPPVNTTTYFEHKVQCLQVELNRAHETIKQMQAQIKHPAFLIDHLHYVHSSLTFMDHASDLCELLGAALFRASSDKQQEARDDRNLMSLHEQLTEALDDAIGEIEEQGYSEPNYVDLYEEERAIDNADRLRSVRDYTGEF